MSDANLPEPPPEDHAFSGPEASKPPADEPPVKEPKMVYEIAPTPPGYKHTLLWLVGIFAVLVVCVCGAAALVVYSGALDTIDQLAKSILTPEPTAIINDGIPVPVQPTLPSAAQATALPATDWKLVYHETFQPHVYGLVNVDEML